MSERASSGGGRGTERLGGLAAVVGWIGAGSVGLAAAALVVDMAFEIPLSQTAAVGLGLALGGGIGGVLSLLASGGQPETADQTVTVETDDSSAPDPQPADLFDGHPDPVLYFADEGNGPVVRAANDAFGTTFDVPTDRLAGTPLSEALLVAGVDDVDATAATATDLDTVVAGEQGPFRLRTAGSATTGYVLFTPAE